MCGTTTLCGGAKYCNTQTDTLHRRTDTDITDCFSWGAMHKSNAMRRCCCPFVRKRIRVAGWLHSLRKLVLLLASSRRPPPQRCSYCLPSSALTGNACCMFLPHSAHFCRHCRRTGQAPLLAAGGGGGGGALLLRAFRHHKNPFHASTHFASNLIFTLIHI